MGGDLPSGKPDYPVKPVFLADVLKGLPQDTVIYFTIGTSATTATQPEQAALIGDLQTSASKSTFTKYVTFNPYVNIRKGPSTASPDIGDLPFRSQVNVWLTSDPSWVQIADGPNAGAYVWAAALSDRKPL